ncbi:hypothetical protein F2P56_036334 [Juglans regia]|uniref:Translocase of chloroplast 120, chloroplastic-like n=2 Tax=Juglans regia TaxID=51240 RepID=A0A2I4GC23_JUGRE|nr:translocase of chloroplast 120, chloroplastic-like [Juglans regia]XP_035542193.1 translocase of chloroplast 120, chloroplastic-like [Juglans regia]KAF5443807.1 hypothetical protein F2P56_036334 [Juglans regia]
MDFVMGNGVDIVDGSQVGEEKSVEVGVSQEGIVERVVVGSSELKDLDGEEVFWEAMSEPKIFPEQLEESDSRYCGSGGGSGHVEVIGEMGLQVVDENPNARIEAERFDEASCVPSVEALMIIEDKVDLVGGKIVDGAVVFEVGTEKEVETDRYSGSREVSDSGENGADGLFEVGSGGEVDIRSDLGIEKSGNRDFNNLTSEQIPVDEKSENGGDKVGGFFIKSLQETELSREILNEEGNGEQLKDDNLRIECQDIESRELKDATAGIALNREDDSSGISYCGGNVKQCQAGADSKYHVETCVLKDDSDDQHTLMEESSVTSVIGGSLSAEMSKTESAGNFLGNENHLRAEDTEVFQLMCADEDDHEVSNNHAEETPTKEDNAAQEERRAQFNGDREIQPAAEPTSSSEKSTNAAPPAHPARPAGLGRAAPLLEPAPRVVQQPRVNGSVSSMQSQQVEDSTNGETEEYDETREKLQMIRVKFLRLAHRLGQTPHNVVVAQVLYRLGLAEQLRGRNGGRVGAFSFDRASAMAEQLEAAGQEPLDFSCTIMVLGKTGVGKSATVNSIFDEVKFGTDAFHLGTKKVQDVVGTVQGIKVRIIDTPGLLPSLSDQTQNEKMLRSVKQFIKKTPPDIVLYLDRLDMQSRDLSDMPLLHTITEIFGPSIWFNAIVVLTHAASAPPDGPNGTASSYDMFVTQRSHVVQQAIRQAAGDMRLMNPVSLVENHSACRTNRAGQRVLPNGQVWKPHLLLLSFASKILAEANTLLKLQDSPTGKPFPNRTRAPPLPFLLSSLLQSRPQLKLPEEQFGDGDDFDDDLDESSDSDEESEFDELPPFKRLTKAQEARLSKSQKKEYFDELEYREKLFMKKQLKEEKKRRKIMKKMASSTKGLPNDLSKDEEESGGAAAVPIPLPDYALPASFDSDNPTHRYRHLDSSHQWLVRPVLDTHGWDHDVGYEGINVERLFVVKDKIPLSFSGQVTKDKKDANVQLEAASSIKHGEGKATSLGFDMQTVGKDLAYTLRSETRFCNFRKNKATAGLSVTLLGDALSAGLKVEDKLIANKRFHLVMTGGAMTARGDVAYGGSLEAQLRDKDYPLGRSLSTLGLSVMDWHGDLAIGCNLQSQIPIGRSSNLIARVNLNNRGAGQASIRLNSSEQIQLALVGLIPLLRKLYGHLQQLSSE